MRRTRLASCIYSVSAVCICSYIESGMAVCLNVSVDKQAIASRDAATPAPHAASKVNPAVAAPTKPAYRQVGIASWYGDRHQGRMTASGQIFDQNRLTAAHRTLPLDTKARVTNLGNGRSVDVTINDRGPYIRGRVIDLSARAARELGMARRGLARVRIEVLARETASSAVD
jgi:rare lipoprotein A